MKKILRTSSVITLLALVSILVQAFSTAKDGFSISAPAIGIAGITIILVLAFAFSRDDRKSDHKHERD